MRPDAERVFEGQRHRLGQLLGTGEHQPKRAELGRRAAAHGRAEGMSAWPGAWSPGIARRVRRSPPASSGLAWQIVPIPELAANQNIV